jgi:hypothetical protein
VKTVAEFGNQLSRQRWHNLLSVTGPLRVTDVTLDALSYLPIQQDKRGIDRLGATAGSSRTIRRGVLTERREVDQRERPGQVRCLIFGALSYCPLGILGAASQSYRR